jgi:SAM-dependent methyltransferase
MAQTLLYDHLSDCLLAYPFPNDEVLSRTLSPWPCLIPPQQDEYDRLGWQHLLIKCLLRNRNWFAPVKSLPSKYPKRVLDIGCGTGQWCREIGMSSWT